MLDDVSTGSVFGGYKGACFSFDGRRFGLWHIYGL